MRLIQLHQNRVFRIIQLYVNYICNFIRHSQAAQNKQQQLMVYRDSDNRCITTATLFMRKNIIFVITLYQVE